MLNYSNPYDVLSETTQTFLMNTSCKKGQNSSIKGDLLSQMTMIEYAIIMKKSRFYARFYV